MNHKVLMRVSLALFLWFYTTHGTCSVRSLSVPEHSASEAFTAFTKAYNSNEEARVRDFVTGYHSGSDEDKTVAYWLALFNEYRELSPYQIDHSWSNDERLAVWFRGEQTKAWVMIMFVMDETGEKIAAKSVLRGHRPEGAVPPFEALDETALSTYLSGYLQRLSSSDYFSGTVLVAKGDKVVFEGAYGKRSAIDDAENSLDTSFLIGSTSKSITALAIAQLVSQGKLKYTDTLSQFVPEYPKQISSQVTIADLLTHTSGLELDDHKPFYDAWLASENLREVLDAQLTHITHLNEGRYADFTVLGEHDYSNENYDLLGIIAERVSGQPLASYLDKQIFRKAGMGHSYADYESLERAGNVATGYTYTTKEGGIQNHRTANSEQRFNTALPSGGYYASVGDLYRFFRAINNGTLIDEAQRSQLFAPHIEMSALPGTRAYYGYGFEIQQRGNTRTIGHSGAWKGAGSQFTYYPDLDYYVIVLSNYDSMSAQTVAHHIGDLIAPN